MSHVPLPTPGQRLYELLAIRSGSPLHWRAWREVGDAEKQRWEDAGETQLTEVLATGSREVRMTLQAFAPAIMDTVLSTLDRHMVAAIPDSDIRDACNAVAQLMRQESAACAEPDDEEGC